MNTGTPDRIRTCGLRIRKPRCYVSTMGLARGRCHETVALGRPRGFRMQGSVVTWKYIHARDSERVLRGVWEEER